ncbi:MAG: hypothetical protein ABI824_08235 [Acidobacteriota bacterium]
MILKRKRSRSTIPGGNFFLQDEKTKTRVSGHGQGDYIRLKDEYGNVWLGAAVLNDDDSVQYRFRDAKGKSMSGVAYGQAVTLRDEQGNTWKGFVD